MDTFAKRLKSVRDNTGMNRSQFGREVGVSGAHISAIEKGRGVSLQFIKSVALRFNVSEDWLTTGNKLQETKQEEGPYDLHGGYKPDFEKSMGIQRGSDEWEALGMLYEIMRDNDPTYCRAIMSSLRAFTAAIRERGRRVQNELDIEELKTQVAELRAIVQGHSRAATYSGPERRSGLDRRESPGVSPDGIEHRSGFDRRTKLATVGNHT